MTNLLSALIKKLTAKSLIPSFPRLNSLVFLLPLLTSAISHVYTQPFQHTYTLEIIRKLPHDNQLFTQGLAVLDGTLYESSGLYGKSSIRKYFSTQQTTIPQYVKKLDARYFGEGIAFYRDELVQLTWHSGVAFRYDRYLNLTGKFYYEGQGWGLCDSGSGFIMSDGSATLTERDYFNFKPKRNIHVKRKGQPLANLNALTFRNDPISGEGYIYANVWQKEYIVEIHALSGHVTAQIDAQILTRENRFAKEAHEKVLNGIVYAPTTKTFFMTGKNWDWLYEVRLR